MHWFIYFLIMNYVVYSLLSNICVGIAFCRINHQSLKFKLFRNVLCWCFFIGAQHWFFCCFLYYYMHGEKVLLCLLEINGILYIISTSEIIERCWNSLSFRVNILCMYQFLYLIKDILKSLIWSCSFYEMCFSGLFFKSFWSVHTLKGLINSA